MSLNMRNPQKPPPAGYYIERAETGSTADRRPPSAMPKRAPQAAAVRVIRDAKEFAAAFGASRAAIDRLAVYEKLLRQWQKAVNLVAAGTLDAVWHRHFADSAQLVPLAPAGTRAWIDLGSGAGFPGLVAAILLADRHASPSPRSRGEGQGEGQQKTREEQQKTREGQQKTREGRQHTPTSEQAAAATTHVTLIESDTRKAAFLREVLRSIGPLPGIAVDILSTRAESARTQVNLALTPRVVSARAVAPLDTLLALAFPLSPPGTTGLFCKGKEVAKEIAAAAASWQFNVALVPSVTDSSGRIAVITDLERKAKD
jgi:16S rRNA (guanine527-N7)-methyltransferase